MPNYKFKNMEVFSSEEWMINASKKYTTVFDKSEITYTWTEFSFYNKLFDEIECTAEISLKSFACNGSRKDALCSLDSDQVMKPKDNNIVIHDGWGSKKPGSWKDEVYWIDNVFMDTLITSIPFFMGDEELKELLN
ncbi:MAG: hypothetical protein WCQ95_03145 [Bacteroidota bacterium]